jgi:E3 ubiquitin-protein ligase CCNP1IP1
LAADQDALRRKNMEIAQAHREKSRKLLQTQELYDKVRRRAEIGHIQQAASDAVDSSLSMAPQINHGFGGATDRDSGEGPMMSSFGQNHRIDMATMNAGVPRSHNAFSREDGRWPRTGSNFHGQYGQESRQLQILIFQAETSYAAVGGLRRHALGSSSLLSGTSSLPGHTGTPAPGSGTRRHSPGNNAPSFANNRVGLTGVGLTSGLKVSQPANMPGLDVSARHH